MKRKTIITHNGRFHADDLFAVETALRFYELQGISRDDVDIVRTREDEVIARGDCVLDVGGIYDPQTLRFDHHQEGGAGARENGVPFAAFGLIWKSFGKDIAGDEDIARAIDERLVQTIDAFDNGVDILGEPKIKIPHRFLLQDFFASLYPAWNEKVYDASHAFEKALAVAHLILEREIVHAQGEGEGNQRALEMYNKTKNMFPEILLLEERLPHSKVVSAHPEILFIIQPSEEKDTWKINVARDEGGIFASRILFPELWGGKRNNELANLTGVPDAVFVHNKRFVAVAKGKDGALSLAKKALMLV
jgi:uncharacterized UPF0160 family protein